MLRPSASQRQVVLALFFFCLSASAQNHVWKEYEIIGQRSITREQVLPYMPVKLGEPYVANSPGWKAACVMIKEGLGLLEAICSSLLTSNFEAYFIVEIIEKGQEHRLKFRPEPTGSPPLATAEILETYEKLYDRIFKLILSGTPSVEFAHPGYLDFNDPQLHAYASRLAELVPPHQENILDVLKNHRDEAFRGKAANLLNWTKANYVLEASRLLDDPSDLVRNNLSRYSLHFIQNVAGSADRQEIVKHLLRQLDRPSHGDRNKSLFALFHLLQAFPSEIPLAKEIGQELIGYTARTSRVFNVGPVAQSILALFASHLPRD